MPAFEPVPALLGGVLIGAAASLLLALNGRIAGITGIAAGALSREPGERAWRWYFLAGMLAAAAVTYRLWPGAFGRAGSAGHSLPVLAAAGLLVGYGTRLANGCTSGHGVCGLARRSPRSLAATATFMATGGAAVYALRHLAGYGS